MLRQHGRYSNLCSGPELRVIDGCRQPVSNKLAMGEDRGHRSHRLSAKTGRMEFLDELFAAPLQVGGTEPGLVART